MSPPCSWKKNACASASRSRKPRMYQTAPPGRGPVRRSPRRRFLLDDGDGGVAISGGDARFRLCKCQVAGFHVNVNGITLAELALENFNGQRIQDPALDRALQRPRPVRRVIALLDDQILRAIGQLHSDLPILQPLDQPAQLDVDDVPHLVASQRMEDDDLVHAVDELGPEMPPE